MLASEAVGASMKVMMMKKEVKFSSFDNRRFTTLPMLSDYNAMNVWVAILFPGDPYIECYRTLRPGPFIAVHCPSPSTQLLSGFCQPSLHTISPVLLSQV